MPDMEENHQNPRKHRVIHWNPEDEEAAERARSSKRKLIAVSVSAAIVVVLLVSVVALWENPDKDAKALTDRLGITDETVPEVPFQQAFASRSKADLELETANSGLEKIRQMRVNHPVLTTKLVAVEREFLQGEDLMRRKAFDRAFETFRGVNAQIEDFSNLVEAKLATQEMYDNFLTRVDELKPSKHLNPEAYDDAFDAASAGKQFLTEGSFTASKTKLTEATDKLQELADSISNYIRQNAALGHRYIAQGQGAKAIEAFTNLLSIDPQNEDAILQIERAKNADDVFSLVKEGEAQERSEAFEEALVAYQQAFEKDPKSAKAQNGVSRVRRKIENRDFSKYLAIAQNAEKSYRFDEAIENFQLALAVFPDRKELADSIAKARADKRQSDITTLITRAYALESENRDWEGARAIYQQLIDMEPNLQEAKDGLLRTGKVIRSILRYEKYLEIAAIEAKRLQYQLARQSWDQAMQSKPDYLELTDEAKRLQQHLITQSRPVQVLFISDMATWVSVQGPTAKKPTKLKESTMNLLPGDYRIIGRKKGYEDIQYRLQIRGGVAQSPLTVICDEKL
jgi:tetratricopeptide (TPR) repeat protein